MRSCSRNDGEPMTKASIEIRPRADIIPQPGWDGQP
jgi:hypothetical protein